MNWCPDHPKYEAKRRPTSHCPRCLKLWLLRSPEDKANVERKAQVYPNPLCEESCVDYYDGYIP